MLNTFTLDLTQYKSGLLISKATIDADTLDSGLATTSEYRRYPK